MVATTAQFSTPLAHEGIAGDRSQRAKFIMLGLVILLLITMFASLLMGATNTSAIQIFNDWINNQPLSRRDALILFDIRLPRTFLAVLVGAALAVSGAVMQALFRNPLADPGLVGVSAGAGLGAITIIVLGNTLSLSIFTWLGDFLLPAAAFMGGLVSTIILYTLSTRGGYTSVAVMLLAGIALAALTGAISGILIYMADDAQLRDLTFWNLGSLAGATWQKIHIALPLIVPSIAASLYLARALNLLALGEAVAGHLGMPVQRTKALAIVAVAAAVGAAVSLCGNIGFVGIIVPHLLRLAIGPDNRYLLPCAALLGAILLLLADMISRIIVAPAELPIGIITAILGGPFFLSILLRSRHSVGF